MARKKTAWDSRKRHECFVCEEPIESQKDARMVASEDPYVNLYIHKKHDESIEELEKILNSKQNLSDYIGDSV